jgi:succinate-acetate transporter protein
MWIGSMRTTAAVQLVFLALWITFLLLAIGALWGLSVATRIGGYAGMITAILAFYASAAEVINEAYGHIVLPVHPYVKAEGPAPAH